MEPSIPPTMKAWAHSECGPHRRVLAQTTLPTPGPPTKDQVLIKVAYSSLNYGDLKAFTHIPSIVRGKNSVPAFDYSGTIVSVGPSTPSHLRIGMRVFGVLETITIFTGQGTLREYICVSPSRSMVSPIPVNFSMEDAGCIGNAGIMSLRMCEAVGVGENRGMRILVNGASGGLGTGVVQVAKAMGAKEIVAICSRPNFELVESLGADKMVDYREHVPLHDFLAKEFAEKKFDVVVDMTGTQELYVNSPGFLKEDGVFTNIGDLASGMWTALFNWMMNKCWPRWLGGTPRKFLFAPSLSLSASERLTKLMAEGKIKAVKERTMGFDEVLEAFDIAASKRARGRIVIKVADSGRDLDT